MGENTIPLVVGVAGHRSIRKGDEETLYAAVKAELEKLKALCPHTEPVMLCSLAEGADQLCARAAAELNIPLTAVLPLPLEDYETDFAGEAREELDRCCSLARKVFVAPAAETVPEDGGDRDFYYRQAGIYIAAHSHVLLVLWDGEPGPMAACGTAAAVDFALEGSYRPASGVSLRWGRNEGVIHIRAYRDGQKGEAAGTAERLGDWEAVEEMLRRTDDFNRLAREGVEETWRFLPGREPDPILDRQEHTGLTADSLSLRFARKYKRVLALLAAAGTILTLAFLLYDEAEAIWLILVCGVMLLGTWFCLRYARRSDCHRRFIEYRALAECLRVQCFLRYGGSRLEAAGLLSWTQQTETPWIMNALLALEPGTDFGERDLLQCWVEDQEAYHRKAGKKSGRDARVSDGIVRTATILSILLYCVGLVFEFIWGGMFFPSAADGEAVELGRTILKTAMGAISAATLFISGYYGHLALSRVLSDHQKMERFYGRMAAQLRLHGQTEELLRVLAREELIENGNWYSYQSDNAPDISF